MTNNHWYPFHVGDYQRKTAHLSLLEHGALRLLIDHYMATGQPLPNDDAKLYRICRARTPSERKAVLSTTAEFFIKDGTLLRNKRCDSEIDKRLKYKNAQSAKAQLRHSRGNATAHTTTTTTTNTARSNNVVVRAREDSDFSIPPPSTPKTMPPPQASGIHQEVRSYISQKLPHLAVKPSFVIDEWLAQGADPDRDIYPAVDRLVDMKRGDIGSYKFFTNAILKSLEDWREQEETYRKVEALYAN